MIPKPVIFRKEVCSKVIPAFMLWMPFTYENSERTPALVNLRS